jgi:copper chaperone
VEARSFVSSTLQDVTLVAPDISCAHCVATIKRSLGDLAGVENVAVDPETKRIEIRFDPARVSLDQIEATLDDEGYPVQK